MANNFNDAQASLTDNTLTDVFTASNKQCVFGKIQNTRHIKSSKNKGIPPDNNFYNTNIDKNGKPDRFELHPELKPHLHDELLMVL